jgi:hypothetical protein
MGGGKEIAVYVCVGSVFERKTKFLQLNRVFTSWDGVGDGGEEGKKEKFLDMVRCSITRIDKHDEEMRYFHQRY